MSLESGLPGEPGYYVVFASGIGSWLDPCVAEWDGESWIDIHSKGEFPKKIFCWEGPMKPGGRKKQAAGLEYDL